MSDLRPLFHRSASCGSYVLIDFCNILFPSSLYTIMEQQLGNADPGYVSCMFCTARCFKLHGSHGGCAAAASTSSSPAWETLLEAGALRNIGNTSRKHRAPFFVKTVKITTVRRKNCELHLPAFFFKDYGDRFQKFVLLQGTSGQVWPVNLCVSCGSTTGRPTVRFSRGWKEFANDHRLELGDKLIFTLASFSRFSVQVFDPLGKKKPTSSNAVSGWSFRREESQNDEDVSRQKKSIFVNWQNKVVRESSLGLGSNERSKKVKSVSGSSGQVSRVAMLCRHLKRDNKTLEKRSNALVAKFRARKAEKSLPLNLLGQKWSNRSRSTSSSDSEEMFNLNDELADDAANLLEWEPLETASPSQLWPLALKSNDPSKALVTMQQVSSGGDSRTQAMNVLSITPNPSSPLRDALDYCEQGHHSANFTDHEEDEDEDEDEDEEEEEPFRVYWKNNKESATLVTPWPTDHKPSPGTRVLNVRPISTLEAPKEIDTVYTPSSPTLISISHCLEPLSREAAQSSHGQDKLSDLGTAVGNPMENRGPRTGGCSDNSNCVSEDHLTPQPCHGQNAVTQVRGISNSSKQSSVRFEKFSHWNRVPFDDNCEGLNRAKSVNGCNPFRAEAEISVPSSPSVDSDSKLEMRVPSKAPLSFSNSTPSRSVISLAYFLHQPRPTARRQSPDQEESVTRSQYSSGGKCPTAKGSTSRSELDRVPENVNLFQKSVAEGALRKATVSVQKLQDVRPSEMCISEKPGVEKANKALQCPAELPVTKTAKCYVDEDFNIRTVSPESKENVPAGAPTIFGPLVVFNSSVRDASCADEGDRLQQKELALPCKRGGKENLKPPAELNLTDNKAADLVLTERNLNHQKTSSPNASLCTISPPTYEYKPAIPCRKDDSITEYLEQKRVARKSRPRLKKENMECGVTNVAVSQRKAVSTTEDIKPYVDASSKFRLDSSSKKRTQMDVLATREEKVRKLGGTFSLAERVPTPRNKIGSGNRCDLVELDGIASDDDEKPADNIFEVEESWDTWREIIQQREKATTHHHCRP